ncbi:MAG TPA: DUF3536 domain-containing protein [Gemmatimonadales bacterium]|nr:DUF3536 domain-containing protein [Gemmatimonadales bacterium]
MHRFIVHGHFYQPPREEPWLDLVGREPTAAPDHDWNSRITRQCYAPLAEAPVFDHGERIRRVINAYAWTSFDVGPTLFRWLDSHAPRVRDAIIAGDRAARERLGFGNAIAMPYNHVILPLASRRDKITEVRWGIRDFRARFGRDPEGMWLPETAVDTETLSVLAQEGIRFTLLAPHQVRHAPRWGRAGRWRGPDGESLAIFVYDGPLAQAVAFSDITRDADRWRTTMLSAPLADDGGATIVSLATDGETFGHHHAFGDLGLAALIEQSEGELTNFAAMLAALPPVQDVQIIEPTSWSCPHGVERWRSDCGCRMEPGTQQQWRAPLRQGLETLAASLHQAVRAAWSAGLGDLDAMRNDAGPELVGAAALPTDARVLLEIERHTLAMFTSCAWFFDDLARLEPRIVLRHAARALDFLPAPLAATFEATLLGTLAHAHSNDPAAGDGVAIWRRDIRGAIHGGARLAAAIAAIRDFAPDAVGDVTLPSYTWRSEGDDIVTAHTRTGHEDRWRTVTDTPGLVARQVVVTGTGTAEPLTVLASDYPEPLRELLLRFARPVVLDAALSAESRAALRDGMVDAALARDLALDGAWQLVMRDGLDAADTVVHGVLDLFDLDAVPLTTPARAEAFLRLAGLPQSPARVRLADRLGLAIPGPEL